MDVSPVAPIKLMTWLLVPPRVIERARRWARFVVEGVASGAIAASSSSSSSSSSSDGAAADHKQDGAVAVPSIATLAPEVLVLLETVRQILTETVFEENEGEIVLVPFNGLFLGMQVC